MAKKPSRPVPSTPPGWKTSDWFFVGLKRLDADGRRQATRIEPYYTHPGLYREAKTAKSNRRKQEILAKAIGLDCPEALDAALHSNVMANIETGKVQPHRKRAMDSGLKSAGMAHLLD
jgi:hypothetical protein